MSLDYIRLRYNVPAYEGKRVRFNPDGSSPIEGVITGVYHGRLIVKPDSGRGRRVYHPTWKIEYL